MSKYYPDDSEINYSVSEFENGSISTTERKRNKGVMPSTRTYSPAGFKRSYCGKCFSGWVYVEAAPGKRMSHSVRPCRCRLEFMQRED